MASARQLTLRLTNNSDRTCTIKGYGGMALVDANGTPIATSTFERSGAKPATVTLTPGKAATRDVQWRDIPSSPDADPKTDCVEAAGCSSPRRTRSPATWW